MDNHFGGVIWTNHALQRLSERGISQGDAWATFSHPGESRYAQAKGAWVFYRDYGHDRIEVVATQNEKKEWVILSVWSRYIHSSGQRKYVSYGFLEKAVEKVLQMLFGKLRNRFKD